MAIVAGNLSVWLTGAASDGAAQADPNASLGGFRSSTQITTGVLNNLWDNTSGAEASAGDTEYRCVCIRNDHATLELTDAKIYIAATGNAQIVISYAVESPTTSNTTGSCQTIVNESTTPTVNTGNCSDWSTATSYATGVALSQGAHDAHLGVGEIMFVWFKRVVAAGATAVNSVGPYVYIQGDTLAA